MKRLLLSVNLDVCETNLVFSEAFFAYETFLHGDLLLVVLG